MVHGYCIENPSESENVVELHKKLFKFKITYKKIYGTYKKVHISDPYRATVLKRQTAIISQINRSNSALAHNQLRKKRYPEVLIYFFPYGFEIIRWPTDNVQFRNRQCHLLLKAHGTRKRRLFVESENSHGAFSDTIG